MSSSRPLIDAEVCPGVRLSSAPALYLETHDTLVVADVHLGYAVSQRDAGRLVPLWGDDEIGRRLAAVIAHYEPRRLVLLGDIVHAAPGAPGAERALADLPSSVDLILVSGNHDRRSRFKACESCTLDGFFLHHGDQSLPVPDNYKEVIGHHHPAVVWRDGAGTRIRMPALVESPKRMILPAFSPWAGGVAWNNRVRPGERLWMVSPGRVFPLEPPP